MIKIVTDSTCDLDEQILAELNVTVVPLNVIIDGKSYRAGVEISNEEFMTKMGKAKELPKTSQPAVGEFLATFNELGKDGSEILAITLTSGMSGTYNSALAAAEMTDAKVTVVDSCFISLALSFQVKEAARMAKLGMRMEEIIDRLNHIRQNTYLYVVVDKLDNLVKGGRIGRGSALIGTLLNIKPIASLADGVYTPVAKMRNYSQVIKYLANQFTEDVKGRTIRGIGVAHASGIEYAHKMKEAVKDLLDDVEMFYINHTSPIVSTHTGAGAIAFMYYTD